MMMRPTPKLWTHDHRRPIYGMDWQHGWIGFCVARDWVGRGIQTLTRHERGPWPPVCHAFVCGSDGSTIEALDTGVTAGTVSAYLDSGRGVIFRKPRGWTDDVGARIVSHARAHLGSPYAWPLIPALAVRGSIIGRALWASYVGRPLLRGLIRAADSPSQWDCSELAAYALRRALPGPHRGVLSDALPAAVTPQALLGDADAWSDRDPVLWLPTKGDADAVQPST